MPPIDGQILPAAKVLAAALIFFASYIVLAIGTFPRLKIDRPGAALLLITRTLEPRRMYAGADWGLLVVFGRRAAVDVADCLLGGCAGPGLSCEDHA